VFVHLLCPLSKTGCVQISAPKPSPNLNPPLTSFVPIPSARHAKIAQVHTHFAFVCGLKQKQKNLTYAKSLRCTPSFRWCVVSMIQTHTAVLVEVALLCLEGVEAGLEGRRTVFLMTGSIAKVMIAPLTPHTLIGAALKNLV
jgi:hypothetical protein